MKESREKIISVLIVAFIVTLFLRAFVVEGFIVRGDSMSPTIASGDYIFINRVAYKFGEPARGDVVIAISRDGENRIVKRIVALPGERLEIDHSGVAIREGRAGEKRSLSESYLPVPTETIGTTTIKLDPQEYFALGDNRAVSVDSRELGPIDHWDIKGKVFFIINWKTLKFKAF